MGGNKYWKNRNDGWREKERKCADLRAEEIYCSRKKKRKKKSFGFSPSCHPTPVLHYWSPFSHFREDTFPRTTFHPSPCLFPPFGRTRNGWQKQGWWPRWRRERNIKKKKKAPRAGHDGDILNTHKTTLYGIVRFRIWPFCRGSANDCRLRPSGFLAEHTETPLDWWGWIFLTSIRPCRLENPNHTNYTLLNAPPWVHFASGVS